ncbi:unnamed protein product [Notodromas monacha]|nr:unnamed protein product [Notodromas monacha]CAG0925503.1 unnamed protein product [Notodromas monacha]
MVCLILLGASAVVGFAGVCRQEIPAVLVTGVLYLLTAIFGLFTVTIMHFKRKTRKDYGLLDQYLSSGFYTTRMFDPGWSYHVGWIGIGACFLASFMWLMLARVMRFHILTAAIS